MNMEYRHRLERLIMMIEGVRLRGARAGSRMWEPTHGSKRVYSTHGWDRVRMSTCKWEHGQPRSISGQLKNIAQIRPRVQEIPGARKTS
jgi:hypothetical protein